MSEHHDHRDDCPFKFATLDVCDCVERNMLDRVKALEAKLTKAEEALRDLTKAFTEKVDVVASRVKALEAKLDAAIKLAELIRKYAGMGMNPSTDLQHMASDLLAILKGENQDGK